MAILKCKMCGGDIELSADKTFGTCEYCGSTMTFPKVEDEQRAAAFNRGNHFRRIGEFDKALAVYERIVREDDTDAEAHWCCALCRFGIEYVEDPASYEYVPTCHRASFDSFLEDVDYLAAVEHSDGITRRQYQKDAARIAEVQRGILATSQNTEPYDVFICYKESDANGDRTRDSLLAQDIYYQLTEQGRKVFFARITLEDIAGAQYEPYIFAALNSAKVMIVVGTKPEHLSAVWVKNEWSRFLAMMKKDHSKLLLPCYRDMDPYDMPEQLSVLQSYDMSKIGFIQDLTRGIAKVLDAEKKQESMKETVVLQQSAAPANNTAPLLKRAFMFLEDGDWNSANEYCEKVLDIDPENAEAYLGKLMAEQRVTKKNNLKNCAHPFDRSSNYQKAVRFGEESLAAELKEYVIFIKERNETARKRMKMIVIIAAIVLIVVATSLILINSVIIPNSKYNDAIVLMEAEKYDEAYRIFLELGDYKDSVDKASFIFKKRVRESLLGDSLKDARVGDYVSFGAYEQDNNISNGTEIVDWLVLDVMDQKMLVISKYALDSRPYNTSDADVTWETCTLRNWLNNNFLNTAFSDTEQSMISMVTVSADKNPEYSINPGNATQDQVFLLSINEVNKYFSSNNKRQCRPTDYAVAQGYALSAMMNCQWWLRSPGAKMNYATSVYAQGNVNEYGMRVFTDNIAVRPAMWIDLSLLE